MAGHLLCQGRRAPNGGGHPPGGLADRAVPSLRLSQGAGEKRDVPGTPPLSSAAAAAAVIAAAPAAIVAIPAPGTAAAAAAHQDHNEDDPQAGAVVVAIVKAH